nr:FLAG-w3-IgA-protM78-420-G4S3-LPETG-His6 [Cloning vector pET24a-FLAG-w3-IgA-protM78-420-G4S3-LPETG-His6]
MDYKDDDDKTSTSPPPVPPRRAAASGSGSPPPVPPRRSGSGSGSGSPPPVPPRRGSKLVDGGSSPSTPPTPSPSTPPGGSPRNDGSYQSEIDLSGGANFREKFRNFANELSEAITNSPKGLDRPVPKTEISGLIKTGDNFITPSFKAGYYDHVASDGSLLSYYQSTEYFNNRVLMPILQTTNGTLMANNRGYDDVFRQVPSFSGWSNTKATTVSTSNNLTYDKWTYFAAKGSPLYDSYPNHFFEDVKTLAIDAKDISALKTTIDSEKPTYLIIRGLSGNGSQLNELQLPESVKKVSLYGDYTGVNVAKQIFANVVELEFYSTSKANSFGFNPLVLGSKTNVIYDLFASKPFTHIDLTQVTLQNSDNSAIDANKLKQAVGDIYNYRRFERQFQGYFAGGYIDKYLVKNVNTNKDSDDDLVYRSLKEASGGGGSGGGGSGGGGSLPETGGSLEHHHHHH